MPAVNPSRLQRQIEDVLKYFDNPGTFHRRMVDLFSLYANRTLQFGESTESRPIAPMYHLPQPLIRQLQMAIKPYLESNPQTALECADELWKDSYLEVKQFAIFILGNVTVQEQDHIIARVESWVSPNLDDRLKYELMSTGMDTLHERFPSAWEKLIQSLLDHKDPKVVGFGIQGIIESVKKTKFGNFPLVFRLISPIIQKPHSAYVEKLEDLINIMANQSPTETAFFLKQTVSLSKSIETKRLIKRCLPLLPEKDRNELKSSLS
jgi:hypothetical protein